MLKNAIKPRSYVFILLGFFFTLIAFSQEASKKRSFSGAITVTNNGISFIPSFNLGKPAAIFDFSLHSTRWSFDPQLRFSLDGKPWTFIFWGRYKLINQPKFKMTLGAHSAIAFKAENLIGVNGFPKTVLNATRYAAAEIVPNYNLTNNLSIGFYYLYSHGLDEGRINNTHFITFNSSIKDIKLTENYFLKWQPQVYYLKTDAKDGFYAASVLTISTKKFPFTISSLVNKAINTKINGTNFVWNLSLSYFY